MRWCSLSKAVWLDLCKPGTQRKKEASGLGGHHDYVCQRDSPRFQREDGYATCQGVAGASIAKEDRLSVTGQESSRYTHWGS